MPRSNLRLATFAMMTSFVAACLTPVGATAQTAALPLDAKAAESKFGTLATLVGTTWAIGDDEVVEITWDRPGVGILITRKGLYGRSETIVVPSARGNSLRYARRSMNFGDVREAIIPLPKKGSYFIKATPGEREECRQSKDRSSCSVRTLSGRSWQADVNVIPTKAQTFVLAPINAGQAQALLSKVAVMGEFPDRPDSTFHPTLGVVAIAANRSWAGDNQQAFFEIWQNGAEISLVAPMLRNGYDEPRPVQFKGSDKVPIAGSYLASHSSDVYRRRPVTLNVREGGAAVFCTTEPNGPKNKWIESIKTCDVYRVDPSGSKLLRYHYALDMPMLRSVMTADVPHRLKSDGFAPVLGRTYRSADGKIHAFRLLNGPPPVLVAEEVSATRRGSLLFGNGIAAKYRIGQDGGVSLVATGEKMVPVPRAAFLLATQALLDEGSIATSLRVKEINRRDNAAFWSGFERDMAQMGGAVQSGAFNSNTWKASPLPFATTSGGSVGDMGGTSYTSAPQMTPQQRAKFDELEQFKFREQIYNGEAPTTFAQDARAKMDGQRSGGSLSSSTAKPPSESPRARADVDDRDEVAQKPAPRWFTCVTTRWGKLPDGSDGVLSHSYGSVLSTLSTNETTARFRAQTGAHGIDGENSGGGCSPAASKAEADANITASMATNKKGPARVLHKTGQNFTYN